MFQFYFSWELSFENVQKHEGKEEVSLGEFGQKVKCEERRKKSKVTQFY
jgi:hypothetical protein